MSLQDVDPQAEHTVMGECEAFCTQGESVVVLVGDAGEAFTACDLVGARQGVQPGCSYREPGSGHVPV